MSFTEILTFKSRPISDFILVKDYIDVSFDKAEELFNSFLKARENPDIIEMDSISRAIEVYNSELEVQKQITKQIRSWKKEVKKINDSDLYQNIIKLEKDQRKYINLVILDKSE
ncbi:hypothetical protein N9X24_02560 [Rickettsiales bacterium]|nr:hypothetical protein [Rickettsiales bacterium]